MHGILLRHFIDMPGAEYVRSRAYTIMHTDENTGLGEAIIEPSSWVQTVEAGMIFEMSIVVLQLTPLLQCPWCKTVTSQDPKDDWLQWFVPFSRALHAAAEC